MSAQVARTRCVHIRSSPRPESAATAASGSNSPSSTVPGDGREPDLDHRSGGAYVNKMKALSSARQAIDNSDSRGLGAAAPGWEPTIYAVAAQANVSIATVSRVLRDSAPVNPETRERVLAAVADLGYTPSRSARSLAEGQHAAHGILFPGLSGPYFAEVVLGYEEVAAELG